MKKILIIISAVLVVFLSVAGIIILSDPSVGENKDGGWSKPLNILLAGGDKASGNTDVIIILNYSPISGEVNAISIPRDTKVTLDGTVRKINFAYPSGGIELLESALHELLGITIDRYLFLDLAAFKESIDILGGVEYNVPVDMKYTDKVQGLFIDLKAGPQVLDGDKAEQFIRFRKPDTFSGLPEGYKDYYNGSDIKRISAQQDFLKELINQKAKLSYLPKINKVFDTLDARIKTDLTLEEVIGYAGSIDGIRIENITMYVAAGTEGTDNGVWYYNYNGKLMHNNETFETAKIIDEYFKANE
jgi:polyisoprenyl-teichoic acid--peptidoglycan teichoic acid transferase